MVDFDIIHYDFTSLCSQCHIPCKNKSKICLAKRILFNKAKQIYKQRLKKGIITDELD